MRAEAVSWDDWSAVNAPPVVEEDKWHVAIAPGEVKVVTLEQLDDLFRLSIVDSEAMVWQNGMSEWQPLRVIAGLDDEPAPAPAPKRTHPKPPSPPSRSAPPPPRPVPVASAPYAQPIITQQAFVAQIAPVVPIRPTTSVRPLVVSAPPPRASSGGGFGRFVVSLALVAGVGVTAYRNGYLREGAHAAHQDALYARLEAALGGPAFGTLRELEEALPHAQGASAASLSGDALALPRDPAPSTSPEVTLNAAKPSEPSHEPAAVAPSGATPPVVSLESLRTEKTAAKAEPAPAPVPVSATPKPVAAPQFAAAPVAKSIAPKAAPVAVAKSTPAAKPAGIPAPEKPSGPMSERERLNAAIGAAMLSSPPTSKKSKKGSEYDPLNPNL